VADAGECGVSSSTLQRNSASECGGLWWLGDVGCEGFGAGCAVMIEKDEKSINIEHNEIFMAL